MSYLVKAIRELKPNSEFAFQNDDYSTIEWHTLEGDAPTAKEIESKIAELIEADAKLAETNAAAKAALLDRLGITADEAKLLLA